METFKGENTNKFNPKDYKSYNDLPEEEKPNYVKIDEGGFVSKEAYNTFIEYAHRATHYNKFRSMIEKLFFGSGKMTAMDLLHINAIWENNKKFSDKIKYQEE